MVTRISFDCYDGINVSCISSKEIVMLKTELLCDHCFIQSVVVSDEDSPPVRFCPHCGTCLAETPEDADE